MLTFASRQAASKRGILVVDPNPAVIERYLVILDVEMFQAGGDFADFDPTTYNSLRLSDALVGHVDR